MRYVLLLSQSTLVARFADVRRLLQIVRQNVENIEQELQDLLEKAKKDLKFVCERFFKPPIIFLT